MKLRKQGISIGQTIYCGFDTEYINVTPTTNKLLSVQLALSTQNMLTLPQTLSYTFSAVNAQTGELSQDTTVVQDCFNWNYLLEVINKSIKIYRSTNYPGLDNSILTLIEGLKKEGRNYFRTESKDKINFVFPNTPIIQHFNRVTDGSYSLTELIQTSNKLVGEDLENSLSSLFKTLKNIHEKSGGLEISLEDLVIQDSEPTTLEELPQIVDLPRTTHEGPLSAEEKSNMDFTQSRRRTWMSSFSTVPLSVSVNTQLYLLIHHSSADLSILSDFESFKDELALVNKTFVTIGKPLKIEGVDVKIRDTQLLVPGGSKGLQALSSLYPQVPKLKISYSDITNMEAFWERDPEKFKAYALQDALITLVHGCRMASFNQELGGLGVPVTLSTLSGRFLKKS